MSVKQHEAFSLDTAQKRFWYCDHFLGDQLQDEWDVNLIGGGTGVVVDAQTGGIVRLTTGAITNNRCDLTWGDIRSLLLTKKATMELRVKLSTTTNVYLRFELRFNDNERVGFNFDTGAADTEWRILTTDGGAQTENDSGITPDTDYHIFRIECHTHGSNHVHYYIDGTETANSPITTNIPDDPTDYFQPRIWIVTRADATKSMDIDYVAIRQDR